MNNINPNLDYEHIITQQINGCKVTIYFQKKENPKSIERALNILMDSFENRVMREVKES